MCPNVIWNVRLFIKPCLQVAYALLPAKLFILCKTKKSGALFPSNGLVININLSNIQWKCYFYTLRNVFVYIYCLLVAGFPASDFVKLAIGL